MYQEIKLIIVSRTEQYAVWCSFYAASYLVVKRTRTDSTESLPTKSEFRSAEENISKVGDAGFV